MFTDYVRQRGAEPSEDIEPTLEQVSATRQIISADMVPFPDVSLIGPHGKRLTHLNWTWLLAPEGMARTTSF